MPTRREKPRRAKKPRPAKKIPFWRFAFVVVCASWVLAGGIVLTAYAVTPTYLGEIVRTIALTTAFALAALGLLAVVVTSAQRR